jgi:hypothetical protein
MIDLIKKLAETNGYEALQISWPHNEFPVYIGPEFEDIVVIAEYSHQEIMAFFNPENAKTSRIMHLYEEVTKSTYSDSAKDMLFIVAHKIDSPTSAHGAEVATQIMRIEENKFGMRIAVLKYTEMGLKQLRDRKEISDSITKREGYTAGQVDSDLTSEETMETALGTEPTFTALQLYAKLPFLPLVNLIGESSVEAIDEKINGLIGDKRKLVDKILGEDSAEFESWSYDEHLAFFTGGGDVTK